MGGAEGSASLQVVSNFAIFSSGVKRQAVVCALLTHNLNVDLRKVFYGERVAFTLVNKLLSLFTNLVESLGEVFFCLSVLLVIQGLQELIVFLVGYQL